MEKLELHGIRQHNAKSVFISLSSHAKTSRAMISRETGLSLMTVGKVIDILINARIASETKESRTSAGRRTGILTLAHELFAIVLDLSHRTFRMTVTDLALKTSDTVSYRYNAKFYYDDNLRVFLKHCRSYLDRRAELSDNYGIGILIPGIYSNTEDRVMNPRIPELASIGIKTEAERVLGHKISVVMKDVEAAALSCLSLIPDRRDRVVAYVFIGESVDGVICDRGRFISGAGGYGCDLGRMILRCGETLEERIRACTSDNMIAEELSPAVYNMIMLLDPDTVIIESSRLREPELFIDNIKGSLRLTYNLPDERIPVFISERAPVRHAARGLAMMLRDRWIDSIM